MRTSFLLPRPTQTPEGHASSQGPSLVSQSTPIGSQGPFQAGGQNPPHFHWVTKSQQGETTTNKKVCVCVCAGTLRFVMLEGTMSNFLRRETVFLMSCRAMWGAEMLYNCRSRRHTSNGGIKRQFALFLRGDTINKHVSSGCDFGMRSPGGIGFSIASRHSGFAYWAYLEVLNIRGPNRNLKFI